MTIKLHDDCIHPQQLILISPSGVQKERMVDEDLYVLSSNGSILFSPLPNPYPHNASKCSDCAPRFMKAYEMHNAGAIIHGHGMESCIATMIHPFAKEFRITLMEMIKGIQGRGYYDELVVPMIENTAQERGLTESLTVAWKNLKQIERSQMLVALMGRTHFGYLGLLILEEGSSSVKLMTITSSMILTSVD